MVIDATSQAIRLLAASHVFKLQTKLPRIVFVTTCKLHDERRAAVSVARRKRENTESQDCILSSVSGNKNEWKYTKICTNRGRRVIGIFRSLTWSKTLMELIFNHCGEFRWSPEGPDSQTHYPHLHVCCLWDLFRSFVCSDAKERLGCGKQRETTTPIQSPVKLQPWFWFLSFRWKICLRQNRSLVSCTCSEGPALGQNTHDDDDDDDDVEIVYISKYYVFAAY